MVIRQLHQRSCLRKCGKGDLNSRTPTRMDSKSTAFSQPSIKHMITFDQTWQFPQKIGNKLLYYFIKRHRNKKIFYTGFKNQIRLN